MYQRCAVHFLCYPSLEIKNEATRAAPKIKVEITVDRAKTAIKVLSMGRKTNRGKLGQVHPFPLNLNETVKNAVSFHT